MNNFQNTSRVVFRQARSPAGSAHSPVRPSAPAPAGARAALRDEKIKGSTLAVLVSCVGRRLVLKHRVEEEVEAVAQSMENGCDIVGFYSYGETCPKSGAGFSELHNQTMTVTVIGEIG